MTMQVIRATAMGLCFGVRDALHALEEISDPNQVTIHGQLVHNEQIQETLQLRGFHSTEEDSREGIPETKQVVITAHGISRREQRRLRQAGKQLIDTTCPLVRRTHLYAQQMQWQGYFILVIGKHHHVEVEGIIGDLSAFAVIQNADEVISYDAPRLGIVCQTTTRPVDAQHILAVIRAKNPSKEIRFMDTICAPTRERQQAAADLLDQVEALVVVGGSTSNNSRQLVEQARDRGIPAVLVQSADDLNPEWLCSFATVGLTAGTSTPDALIEEIHTALLEIGSPMRAPRV